MIILSGIGVHDAGDIPLKTIIEAQTCDDVFLESYTNLYHSPVSDIEQILKTKVRVVERSFMEDGLEELVELGKNQKIMVLVPGDPLTATTHMELVIECRKKNIPLRVIHASSILNAVSITGLQAYKFGKTTTLAYLEDNYKPTSPLKVIGENHEKGLHTLVLLDVKSEENRYMTVNEGLATLLELEAQAGDGIITETVNVIGCSRIGADDAMLKYGVVSDLKKTDFGLPPHCIIVPGDLHFKEEEALKQIML